ncbi:uncharacterized protein A4U43_C06F15420 [Asparagus officinalis]|uniref:Uncharacterized protein n=1 Tax=Asparagus officinalis TaxID=4686 RepID=A0A5P1EPL3_ASPOF|nr:uncharacterized protein A4U43_C06F15420 [Asparagus officinalis]
MNFTKSEDNSSFAHSKACLTNLNFAKGKANFTESKTILFEDSPSFAQSKMSFASNEVSDIDWRSRKLSKLDYMMMKKNHRLRSIMMMMRRKALMKLTKKMKVEDSDPDYVPSKNTHTTAKVNVSIAAKIKDEEEADKMFTEAMGILEAI